jgi:hypothetical protein
LLAWIWQKTVNLLLPDYPRFADCCVVNSQLFGSELPVRVRYFTF